MPVIFIPLISALIEFFTFVFLWIIRIFVVKFVFKIAQFLVVIGVWYALYSFIVDFVNEKIAFLFSDTSVFSSPIWISVSSCFPSNLSFCLNLIFQIWSLYIAFRVKKFILGLLAVGVFS